MLFDGIIINISIMLTGFYFISKLTASPLDAELSLSKKVQVGLCNGLLCFVLMKFAILTIHYTFIDLRHIPLIIAACYVGPIPTVITAFIISASRLTISFNDTAILISALYGLLGMILALCSHYIQRSLFYRAILFSMISLIFICLGYFMVMQDIANIVKFCLIMTFSSALGMQFSFIMMDCPVPLAKKIAEEIRQKIESNPFCLPNGQQINITISIGISSSEQQYDNNRLSLFQRADLALYQAKSNGRNQTSYISDDIALALISN